MAGSEDMLFQHPIIVFCQVLAIPVKLLWIFLLTSKPLDFTPKQKVRHSCGYRQRVYAL